MPRSERRSSRESVRDKATPYGSTGLSSRFDDVGLSSRLCEDSTHEPTGKVQSGKNGKIKDGELTRDKSKSKSFPTSLRNRSTSEEAASKTALLSRSMDGKLGLQLGEHPDTKEVIITEIFKGYSADDQTLCVGDVIVAINGHSPRDANDAYTLCRKTSELTESKDLVEIQTKNYRATRNVWLRRRVGANAPDSPESTVLRLGLGFGRDKQGRLAVTDLFPGYEAVEKLLVGDRVLSINGQEVEDPVVATRVCTEADDVVELRVITSRVWHTSERSDQFSRALSCPSGSFSANQAMSATI